MAICYGSPGKAVRLSLNMCISILFYIHPCWSPYEEGSPCRCLQVDGLMRGAGPNVQVLK